MSGNFGGILAIAMMYFVGGAAVGAIVFTAVRQRDAEMARDEALKEAREEAREAIASSAKEALDASGKRLFDCAQAGNIVMLRKLVGQHAGNRAVLNWAFPPYVWKGYTPLHISVSSQQLEAVQLLVKTPGIDVNKVDSRGWSPLMLAADFFVSKYSPELVRALLDAPGIDVNLADKAGWTAIMKFASNGSIEAVSALLAAPGIDVNKRATSGGNEGMTALGLAKSHKHRQAVDLLRAAKALE